jgi:hypothetical protein
MTQHQFLLSPSSWLGQGKIQLNMVSEELAFFTRWDVSNVDGDGRIECNQEIQVKGLSDIMSNEFLIYNLTGGEFSIELENQALGKITGKGLVNDKVIAWEFRVEEIGFEGFELYEKQDEKNYLMRAEYATSDQFRTLIQGRVWQQTAQTQDP